VSKVDKLQKLLFEICVNCSAYHPHVASAKVYTQ